VLDALKGFVAAFVFAHTVSPLAGVLAAVLVVSSGCGSSSAAVPPAAATPAATPPVLAQTGRPAPRPWVQLLLGVLAIALGLLLLAVRRGLMIIR